VHEAHRVGVILERNTPRDRRGDSLVPPRLVDDRIRIAIEHP
jgi:hypothetical protein